MQEEEQQDQIKHARLNPCKNWYEYQEEKKAETLRQFKEKINKNDTF